MAFLHVIKLDPETFGHFGDWFISCLLIQDVIDNLERGKGSVVWKKYYPRRKNNGLKLKFCLRSILKGFLLRLSRTSSQNEIG